LGGNVASLYQQIAEKFLTKLAESKHADNERIRNLRVLFADGRKVKSDEFVNVFCAPVDDLK
jgi:hypothetical protein